MAILQPHIGGGGKDDFACEMSSQAGRPLDRQARGNRSSLAERACLRNSVAQARFAERMRPSGLRGGGNEKLMSARDPFASGKAKAFLLRRARKRTGNALLNRKAVREVTERLWAEYEPLLAALRWSSPKNWLQPLKV